MSEIASESATGKERQFLAIFRSFAEEWNLDDAMIRGAVDRALEDNVMPDEKNVLLLFLYAKDLSEYESDSRKSVYSSLLSGRTRVPGALERLKTIVIKGETSPTRVGAEYPFFFDKFVEENPEWNPQNQENILVIFKNHPKMAGIPPLLTLGKQHTLVERLQLSGLCYMHAPIVMQHYLVAMNRSDDVPMLNLAEFLKKHMSSSSLWGHILRNDGGESLPFLQSIIASPIRSENIISVLATHLPAQENYLAELLHLYGPGLVSGFLVRKSFDSSISKHHGTLENEEPLGKHAMVLVGYRRETGKLFFLLQNWWTKKPYFEVDAEYLAGAQAMIHFVKEKQTQMGQFPVNYEEMVECEPGMEAGETYMEY